MQKIELGSRVEDKITGFAGIAIGRATYITGCDQLLVQPNQQITIGSPTAFVEGRWFDEGRLKVSGKGINVADLQADKNGCDISAPIK